MIYSISSDRQFLAILLISMLSWLWIRPFCFSIISYSLPKSEYKRRTRERRKIKTTGKRFFFEWLFYTKYRDVLPKKFVILNYYLTIFLPCLTVLILFGFFSEFLRCIANILLYCTYLITIFIAIFLFLTSHKTGKCRLFNWKD